MTKPPLSVAKHPKTVLQNQINLLQSDIGILKKGTLLLSSSDIKRGYGTVTGKIIPLTIGFKWPQLKLITINLLNVRSMVTVIRRYYNKIEANQLIGETGTSSMKPKESNKVTKKYMLATLRYCS